MTMKIALRPYHRVEDVAQSATTAQLIKDAYLAPYAAFAPTEVPDLSRIGSRAGDFAVDQLSSVMARPVVIGSAVASYERFAIGKRAVAFGVDRAHSMALAQRFTENGHQAVHLDPPMSVGASSRPSPPAKSKSSRTADSSVKASMFPLWRQCCWRGRRRARPCTCSRSVAPCVYRPARIARLCWIWLATSADMGCRMPLRQVALARNYKVGWVQYRLRELGVA